MIDNTCEMKLEQQWKKMFPSILSGLLSFYQCLCTIGIVGCELGSILIDLFHATIYVGFWASLFFTIAWISQAVAVSCRETRRCATYTLIFQCIALIFAICIIIFDSYFLINPTVCFFSLSLCNSTNSVRGLFYSTENFNNIKIPLIKGQLAIAVVMFAFYIDYIIIYVVTHIRMKKNKQLIVKNSNKDVSTSINGTINVVPMKTADTDILINNENTTKSSSSPTTDINKPTTDINPPTTNIDIPTKGINPPTTDINIPTEDINPSTTDISIRTKDMNPSTMDINTPTKDINSPTTDINIPTTDINTPTTAINTSRDGALNTLTVKSINCSRWSMDSDDT